MTDYARQYRCGMIQGSNQARTWRSAITQVREGRPGDLFLGVSFWFACRVKSRVEFQALGIVGSPPTEGKGAADQLPVAPDGKIGPHLVLGPAQGLFDLFVALFDPDTQAIEPDDFHQIGSRQVALGGLYRPGYG